MPFDLEKSIAAWRRPYEVNATFSDEDLLIFNPNGSSWSLAFDGSASDPAWIAADLDATYAVLVNGDVIFYGGFESLIQRDPN